MEEKKSFFFFFREHRKELLISGISMATIMGIVFSIKHKDSLIELWNILKSIIDKSAFATSVIDKDETLEWIEPIVENKPVQTLITIDPGCLERLPHDVKAHLRVLPSGQHASSEKIATAAENGFDLSVGGITWVKDYSTGLVA